MPIIEIPRKMLSFGRLDIGYWNLFGD